MSGRLDRGGLAPPFRTSDLDGRTVDPRDHGGRWLLLSFYRYASCPLCNLRVHELAHRQPRWHAAGLDLVAVFQSPGERLRRYVGTRQPPFPLVSDPTERLYRLYGVGHSWRGFAAAWLTRLPTIARAVIGHGFLPGSVEGGIHRLPADFLIGPDGRLAEVYYGRDIGDHLPIERIEARLHRAGLP